MFTNFVTGRITDGSGTTVECKESIFIMTSNLATTEIIEYTLKNRKNSEMLPISKDFKENIIQPILKKVTLNCKSHQILAKWESF